MVVDLSDLVEHRTVLTGLACASRKAVLQLIATTAADAFGLDAGAVGDGLAARERLGSTGFGGGVALPHARLEGLDTVRAVLIRLDRPVPWAAVDELPVDLVFALLSPTAAGASHLKALARVSRAMRDGAFVAKLRGAASADAMYALLTGDHARDAA